ncbi:GNAT family acetyltransferase [Leucobacter zeae]|nr:GNAT family acetyltransferase [Leucobacter zeae]
MGLEIRAFAHGDTDAVVALWETCGLTRPWNDPRRDIERKLRVQPELFLVAVDPGTAAVIGSVMGGYDGHRGWIYFLASAPDRRGEGIARALLAAVEAGLLELGCPKAQLMVRSENSGVVDFYDRLGYAGSDVLVRGKRLIED